MLAEAVAPFTRRRTLENTYAYGGGIVSILASGEDTAGAFCFSEWAQKPGSEPPMHVHSKEDELLYLTQGSLQVTVGGVIHQISAGDTIFLPRGTPHTFRITSGVARALALITPSGFAGEELRPAGALGSASPGDVGCHEEVARRVGSPHH